MSSPCRLRQFIGARPARFIAVTGYGQARDQAMSREAGFDHHLVKPVDLAEVQALLELTAACSPRQAVNDAGSNATR